MDNEIIITLRLGHMMEMENGDFNISAYAKEVLELVKRAYPTSQVTVTWEENTEGRTQIIADDEYHIKNIITNIDTSEERFWKEGKMNGN